MASKEKKIVPPKLNKFMHPRNPYKTPPSFKKLALAYPDFRAHCTYDLGDKVHLDFKNPDALRALTTCLLHQDFGLEVTIPEGRLVPTLPLRLNYLLWLEDLLSKAARRRGGDGGQRAAAVIGADIGTGAACVYPLLGAAHFGWCMLGTETDPESFKSAMENVEKNGLAGQIAVLKVEDKTILKALDCSETLARVSTLRPRSGGGGGRLSHSSSPKKAPGHLLETLHLAGKTEESKEGKKEEAEGKDKGKNGKEKKQEESAFECERDYTFDFTMCNPPFFSSEEELDTMAKSKKGRGEPCAAPTGSAHEKVTEGGEVEFIRQMVEESHLQKDRVRIFTTLIGTKAHIKEVRRMVEAAKPTSSVFTEFCQGRTMRWGVAWTFAAGVNLGEVRSKKEMATNKPIVLLLPRTLMTVYSVPAAWAKVQGWLKALKVKVEVFKSNKYFVSATIKAFKPTWQNQRRRRREKHREGQHQHQQNGKSSKEEVGEDVKRKAEEEAEGDKERESKRVRIATEEEVSGGETSRETVEDIEEEEEEEMDEEEEAQEESNLETTPTKSDQQKTPSQMGTWDECKEHKSGLKCILKCNFQVKQTGGLISVEAYYLGGSCGKDGLNQLVQYMRNQLSKPLV